VTTIHAAGKKPVTGDSGRRSLVALVRLYRNSVLDVLTAHSLNLEEILVQARAQRSLGDQEFTERLLVASKNKIVQR
jgi:hypothetical protein